MHHTYAVTVHTVRERIMNLGKKNRSRGRRLVSLMPVEPTRKAWDKPAPYYVPNPGLKEHEKDASGVNLQTWRTILAFMDSHPDMGPTAIAQHFRSRRDGALLFTQPTLFRIQEELQARAQFNLNMPSLQIVLRPDVERALVLWLRSTIAKREPVTDQMLMEKVKCFEEKLNVSPMQCLRGSDWIPFFWQT
jgi:hypothetical protein